MSSTISLTRASAPADLHFRARLGTVIRWLRTHPTILIGSAVIAFWIIGTLLVPLSGRDPLGQDINHSLNPPDASFLWGADKLGRDIFIRVLYGARLTLPAGAVAVVGSVVIGTLVGGVAGYAGGLWEELLMRLTDVFLAFPTIILAMAIAAALGPSINNAILTIAVISWPSYARLTRGLVLQLKTTEFVQADRAIGARHRRILFRSILPNCVGSLVVMATLDFGNAVLIFAGLSFLGLGPAPETPEWGRMIADGVDYADQWWVSIFPGLAIFSVVMALNFVGDGLRDLFDPREARR